MGVVSWISAYFVIWWTVLFVILPLGVKTHAEEGTEPFPGADAGAPANPNIKRKFITTTWVSAIVLFVAVVVVQSGIVPLPNLPQG